MPSMPWMRQAAWPWFGLCVLLALPAWLTPVIDLDAPQSWSTTAAYWTLHPNTGWDQSLASWWATAWLHGSAPHLRNNLAGTALLAVMGWMVHANWRSTIAWAMAWPLTHIGMLLRPEITSYIGLSGVLHAGATVLALQQIITPFQPHHRQSGWILLGCLVFKIFMENPWGAVLILSSSSAIKVAPWAHFSGALAGLACGVLIFGWTKLRRPLS